MTKEERREYYRKLEMTAADQERADRREKQRRAWDFVHYRTISCRVPVDVARRFEALCTKHHTTRYRAIRQAVEAALRDDVHEEERRKEHDKRMAAAATNGGVVVRRLGSYQRPFEE